MSTDDTIADQIRGLAINHGLPGMIGLIDEVSKVCLRESLRHVPDSDGYNGWKYLGDILDLAITRMKAHESK